MAERPAPSAVTLSSHKRPMFSCNRCLVLCLCLWLCVCVCASDYVSVSVPVPVSMSVSVSVCVCLVSVYLLRLYTYAYAFPHTHTHHTHTYIHTTSTHTLTTLDHWLMTHSKHTGLTAHRRLYSEEGRRWQVLSLTPLYSHTHVNIDMTPLCTHASIHSFLKLILKNNKRSFSIWRCTYKQHVCAFISLDGNTYSLRLFTKTPFFETGRGTSL
jgi:hypothetical protein